MIAVVLMFALPRLKSAGRRAISPSCRHGSKNLSADLLAGHGGEVGHAMPHSQIVGNINFVDHDDGCLRELNVEAHAERRWPVIRPGDEAAEIDGARYMHKAYVLLTAQIEWTVDHREEQSRIHGNGCVIDHSAGWIMEAGFREVSEVKPVGVKEAVPVMHLAIDDGAAVELSAHSIKEQTLVNGQGFKGTFWQLERHVHIQKQACLA